MLCVGRGWGNGALFLSLLLLTVALMLVLVVAMLGWGGGELRCPLMLLLVVVALSLTRPVACTAVAQNPVKCVAAGGHFVASGGGDDQIHLYDMKVSMCVCVHACVLVCVCARARACVCACVATALMCVQVCIQSVNMQESFQTNTWPFRGCV